LIPALSALEEEGLADDLEWNVIFVSTSEDPQTINQLCTKELEWTKVDLNRKYL
jgi:hypothetical protein